MHDRGVVPVEYAANVGEGIAFLSRLDGKMPSRVLHLKPLSF
jgi:hypothetical protein